jgi:hypothetical protein
MIGEEGFDTPFGNELTTQRRRVEQFTVSFAESLHRTILNDQAAQRRHCAPIKSTLS